MSLTNVDVIVKLYNDIDKDLKIYLQIYVVHWQTKYEYTLYIHRIYTVSRDMSMYVYMQIEQSFAPDISIYCIWIHIEYVYTVYYIYIYIYSIYTYAHICVCLHVNTHVYVYTLFIDGLLSSWSGGRKATLCCCFDFTSWLLSTMKS